MCGVDWLFLHAPALVAFFALLGRLFGDLTDAHTSGRVEGLADVVTGAAPIWDSTSVQSLCKPISHRSCSSAYGLRPQSGRLCILHYPVCL
jgi:hypothetical protein